MDESIVYSWLVGASPSAVSAIVGDRVYPSTAPQDATRPFIVYSLIAATPQNKMNGAPDIDNRRVQIDCYQTTYKAARHLLDLVRAELEYADRCYCIGENFILYEPETKLYRASADFSIWLAR